MTDPSNGQEPSMEDILASIRRIIDEDDRKAVPQGAQAPQADDGGDDVLELTDAVEEATDEADIWESEPETPADVVASDTPASHENASAHQEETATGIETEARERSDPVAAQEYNRHGDGDDLPAEQESTMSTTNKDRLVSDAALSSAAAALGSLARASERDPLSDVPRGRPVEDLAMELLRPMLRDWLDEHLPTIVERIVEREVRYLSRRLGGDDGA